MKKLIKKSYQATVKRGLIKSETTKFDFLDKIHEELNEAKFEARTGNNKHMFTEVADIALVCFNFAYHYGVDLVKVMEEKTEYNLKRED